MISKFLNMKAYMLLLVVSLPLLSGCLGGGGGSNASGASGLEQIAQVTDITPIEIPPPECVGDLCDGRETIVNPEPATLLLLGSGMLAAGLYRRKK